MGFGQVVDGGRLMVSAIVEDCEDVLLILCIDIELECLIISSLHVLSAEITTERRTRWHEGWIACA